MEAGSVTRLALPAEPRVLCIGAHCDDIEIGCGGTLLKLRATYPQLRVQWVVFASTDQRARELRASAAKFIGAEGADGVVVHAMRDGFLPYHGATVKEEFEALKSQPSPDLVFTHWRGDAHQDHRLVSELTWNTFRDHTILEYEIPKWDGDMGRPNVYVALTEEQLNAKIGFIMDVYATQRGKDWFDEDTIRGLARLRGMESRAPARYAEAFHAYKLRLSF